MELNQKGYLSDCFVKYVDVCLGETNLVQVEKMLKCIKVVSCFIEYPHEESLGFTIVVLLWAR